MRPFTPRTRHGIAIALTFATGLTGCGGGGGSSGSASVAPGITGQEGTFANVGPLSRARAFHTATLLDDGRILIVGGLVGPTLGSAEVELFDPSTGQVSAAAPMTTARLQHEAVLLPTKKVLVIGGLSDRFGAALSTTELYDPVTNLWTAGPALTEGRASPAVTLYDQGRKVLIAGGYTWSSGLPVVSRTADIFSADSSTVAAARGQMQAPRCDAEAITQGNGQLLLASGFRSVAQGQPAPSEVYDIQNDLFIPVNVIEERAEAAVAIVDSKLFGIGGVTSASAALASAEQFDGQSWSAAASLRRARQAFTATPSGANAVIIGGRDGASVLGSVELFPASVALVASGQSLSDPRYSHTATRAGDRIYVIGGFTTNEDLLASIEVFAPNAAALPGAGAGKGTRVSGKATPPPAAALQITSINPTIGPVGASVELTGIGFDASAANNVVRFNGVQAQVRSVNQTNPQAQKLAVVVPAGATTGAVTVQVNGVVATGPVFTVGSGGSTPTGPTPRILFVLPNSARSFLPISITGQDFGQQPVVTFNGVPTINIVNLRTSSLPFIGSVSELIVIVPPGATSGPLTITSNGVSSNPFYFTVR